MPIDEFENDWAYVRGNFMYEFQTQTAPRKRIWPPPKEQILAAQKAWSLGVLKGKKYHIGSLRHNGGKLSAGSIPAFFKPRNQYLPSRLFEAQVFFDLNGKITDVYPPDAIPMPKLILQYQKAIHKARKGLRKDKVKGYRNNKFFVRFGKWSGASKFGLGSGGSYEEPDEWASYGKNYEAGVSVYHVERQREGKGWVLQNVNQREALHSVGGDYWRDMLGRALKNRKIFLLRGDLVTIEDNNGKKYMVYGSDGEPLLVPESIQIIKKLSPWEVRLSEGSPPIKTQFGWKTAAQKLASDYLKLKKLPLAKLTAIDADGEKVTFQTGKPVRFPYFRNNTPAPNLGPRFGQDIEPAGKYLSFQEKGSLPLPGQENGVVFLKNPIVLQFGGYGPNGWKNLLRINFQGYTGKKLSNLIKKYGYDSIVTIYIKTSTPYVAEIVKL